MGNEIIKIGVVGAGHLGKMHIKNLNNLPEVDFVGFYDSDKKRSKEISKELNILSFNSLNTLLEQCDGVSIVVPTVAHYDVALSAIKKKVHIFCEKPFMQTIEEANEVIKLARDNNIVLQIGHIERFNPALASLKKIKINPLFIESHRISQFNPRGTDVAVILDLMIHDIDIILSLVNSPIIRIDAAGAPILTDNIDIANARIKFKNGCVANITASRVSNKSMRKIRVFQRNAYISIDFLKNLTEVFSLSNEDEITNKNAIPITEIETKNNKKRKIFYEQLQTSKSNAMLEELRAFVNSIKNGTLPLVTGEDGKKALEVAIQIEKQISSNLKKLV